MTHAGHDRGKCLLAAAVCTLVCPGLLGDRPSDFGLPIAIASDTVLNTDGLH